MTKPPRATSANQPGGRTVESVLGDDILLLASAVDEAIRSGDVATLLSLASEVGGKVRAVASVLAHPCPETVSGYLRHVASGIASSGSRRFAVSSLQLLQAALRSAL